MEGCYLKINGDSNYGSFEKTFIIAQNHIEKIEINVKNGIVNIKLFKNELFKIPIVFK